MNLKLIDLESHMMMKYGVRGVPEEEAATNIQYVMSVIEPKLLKGTEHKLVNIVNTPICNHYKRIVFCGYGAYVELNQSMLKSYLKYDEPKKMGVHKPFINYTFDDGWHTRIRLMTGPVTFGDFIPGAFYVNVGEVWLAEDYVPLIEWLPHQDTEAAV